MMASLAMHGPMLDSAASLSERLPWRRSGAFRGTVLAVGSSPPLRKPRLTLDGPRAGLPAVISNVPVLGPLLNTLLSPVLLFAVYAVGATRFFSGFSNTTYSDSLPTKLALTLAWPVLFIASQKYRNNFKRAVR